MNYYIPTIGKNCKVVTSAQMQQVDRTTIEEIGVPGVVLMENAGRATAMEIDKFITSKSKSAFIFTGRGNNGGDGFVVARHLVNWGWNVRLFLFAEIERLTGDARINGDICRNLGFEMELITPENLKQIDFSDADVLVDAILGTGIKGAVRGLAAEGIKLMNKSGVPIVAVDVPSGLNTDSGNVVGACVRAVMTCTMGLPKIGQLIPAGLNYVGDLRVLEIGFPRHLTENEEIKTELLKQSYITNMLPKRRIDVHKGSCGKVLIVAGSPGMTGAATMSCQSAYLSGAGYVTLAMPHSVSQILEVKLTEVVKKSLPQSDAGSLHPDALPQIVELAEKCDALAIGPGMSQHPQTQELIRSLIKNIENPMIIDADGLNALAKDISILSQKRSDQIVLTPHIGEMSRLSEISTAELAADRLEISKKMAKKWGVTIVLKGAGSIIAAPDGQVAINSTGNGGMATAGSGDVLTGIIATFLSQGLRARQAAQAGVYIHGYAGDRATAAIGQRSLVATDIMNHLSQTFQQIEIST